MQQKMYALTYRLDINDKSFAITLAVSNNVRKLTEYMNEQAIIECKVKNFVISKTFDDGIILTHNLVDDLCVEYRVTEVLVFQCNKKNKDYG